MNAQQMVLTGVVLVIAAIAGVSLLSKHAEAPGEVPTPERAESLSVRAPDRDPASWDMSQIPGGEVPLRSFPSEPGVLVQVLSEGEGEPIRLGRPVDLRVRLYLLNGTMIENAVARGLVYGQRRPGLEGLMAGLRDIRPYERRRVLVPNELAHGARRVKQAPPYADVVYDIRWIYFHNTDLKLGSGAEAKQGSRVRVLYRGTLEDGTVFDQTKPGEPASFVLLRRKVIDGFRLGIRGMRVGGERRIWVPSHLGYGEGGSPPKVPAFANLIFVVELLDVLE